MEEYKQIIDFENYEVSNLGNVRNIKTGKILKPRIDRDGYYQVCLCKDKKKKTPKIHRLVAESFIENPENKPCVDHINNDKLDNNVENLRWATLNENQYNRKINKNNTSKVKGVCFDKNRNKWRAHMKIDGISIHIGSYNTLGEAKEARVKRANEVFGVYTNECEKIKLT